jgi:hypothetical protein
MSITKKIGKKKNPYDKISFWEYFEIGWNIFLK